MRYASIFSVGWGIGLAPCTMGMSLLGSAYSARQIHIIYQQVKLIEREIASRDGEIPRHRKRDFVYGVMIGLTGVVIGVGIGQCIQPLIGPVVVGLASSGVTVLAHQAAPTSDAIHHAVPDVSSGATDKKDTSPDTTSKKATSPDTTLKKGTSPDTTSKPPTGDAAFIDVEKLGVEAITAVEKSGGDALAQAFGDLLYDSEHPENS